MTYSDIISSVIAKDEGGWVLSQDADGGDGGWTFGGITRKTWEACTPTRLDFAAVQNRLLTAEGGEDLISQGCAIYKSEYWDKAHLDEIHETHQEMMFSCAINRGPANAVKALQTAVGVVAVDGDFGPDTLVMYARFNTENFERRFCRAWMRQYFDVCKAIPEKIQFLLGWFNRVERFR